MSQATPRYDKWLPGYLARGERLQAALLETFLTVRGSSALALPELRLRRASFPHKFCLIQYASAYDETLATNLFDQLGLRVTEEEHSTIREMTAETVREALAVLMVMLDQMETHLVLVERPNERPPDGPVRLKSPDESWFPMFAQLAELAQAIILPGGIGPHVMQEVQYLRDAGLARRIVLYVNGKLFHPKNPTVHTLADLKEAIEMAAAQSPSQESGAFIQDPQYRSGR